MMDESMLNLARSVAGELEEAIRPIGLAMRWLDAAETASVPTVVVEPENGRGRAVICNIMPVEMQGVAMTFLQLYMTLTGPVAEDRREELDGFVKGANERFMLGSLLTFQGGLCMRYTLAMDPAEALEPSHIQTTFTALYQQGAVFAKLGGAVGSGAMTAEAALACRE